MHRRFEKFYSPAVGRDMEMLLFGHYGTPMIVFPTDGGRFHDVEDNGMVGAVSHLIDAGKLKLYCPESLDNESWLRQDIDAHWRGVRHNAYQDFIVKDLVPAVRMDCQSNDAKIALAGCGLGAYHAANFALKFPHLFNYALCMSGRYDLEKITGLSNSQEVYFNNPTAYVPNLQGEALEQIRQTHIVLVCGQGAFEDKCLEEINRLADLLAQKGISHERDLWGYDVEHHWYWWRKQFLHHLNKSLS
jgi:esterase/lipase superfamily enzyme